MSLPRGDDLLALLREREERRATDRTGRDTNLSRHTMEAREDERPGQHG